MIILEQWDLSPFRKRSSLSDHVVLDGKSTIVALCKYTPKSVAFYINETKVNVENIYPFTITQSNGDDHTPFILSPGTYALKVVSYSDVSERGHVIATTTRTIHVS